MGYRRRWKKRSLGGTFRKNRPDLCDEESEEGEKEQEIELREKRKDKNSKKRKIKPGKTKKRKSEDDEYAGSDREIEIVESGESDQESGRRKKKKDRRKMTKKMKYTRTRKKLVFVNKKSNVEMKVTMKGVEERGDLETRMEEKRTAKIMRKMEVRKKLVRRKLRRQNQTVKMTRMKRGQKRMK